jgi:RNA polymerase sigma-70 factor (sigma-E family)
MHSVLPPAVTKGSWFGTQPEASAGTLITVGADPGAIFDDFVRGNYEGLVRLGVVMTGQRAFAEDLAQEALARTWLRAQRSLPEDLGAYVRRVMVNTYTSWWRGVLRREQLVDVVPEVGAQSEDVAAQRAQADELLQALRRLSRGQRAVLALRYYEQRTEREIADLLGCSIGTVKSQASAGIRRLRSDPMLTGSVRGQLTSEECAGS